MSGHPAHDIYSQTRHRQSIALALFRATPLVSYWEPPSNTNAHSKTADAHRETVDIPRRNVANLLPHEFCSPKQNSCDRSLLFPKTDDQRFARSGCQSTEDRSRNGRSSPETIPNEICWPSAASSIGNFVGSFVVAPSMNSSCEFPTELVRTDQVSRFSRLHRTNHLRWSGTTRTQANAVVTASHSHARPPGPLST